MLSKSAADIGATAELVCEAQGVPNVTFRWVRRTSSTSYLTAKDDARYQFHAEATDPLNFRSTMVIHNVSGKDYGSYECVARNTEGMMKKSRPAGR